MTLLCLSACNRGKENCTKLVKLACEHVSDRKNGLEECERLTKQAESVSDESCGKTLQLLKESGKFQKKRR